jgi:hypothetical protein
MGHALAGCGERGTAALQKRRTIRLEDVTSSARRKRRQGKNEGKG